MASNTFLYKPVSDHGQLVVLTPSYVPEGATVDLLDAQGNVVESGRYTGRANQNRGHYRFSKPGAQYGNDVQVRITSGDQSTIVNVGSGGQRLESSGQDLGILSGQGAGGGYTTSAAGYIPSVDEAGDYPRVEPGFFPFETLGTPQVDFPGAVGFAYGQGDINRQLYYQNILGPQAQAAGLGATATDIAGIAMGAEALAPMVREQGRLDTAENISRARAIDEFNLQRYPQFSEQAREQREAAIEATGVDYRDRMTSLLDQLAGQAEGRIPETMAEDFARYQAGRGADIAAASGISGISGAGVRVQDRLNVMERMGMMERAQAQIPGVATTAQQVLEAPTFYAQPTQVPFTPSNIAARLPVQANISAGQAQLQAGQTATQLSTISPTNLLSAGINTAQWNEMMNYDRDRYVAERIQGQISAADASVASDIRTELGLELQEEAQDRYDQERWWDFINQGIQAGASYMGRQTATGQATQAGTQPTPTSPTGQPMTVEEQQVAAAEATAGPVPEGGFVSIPEAQETQTGVTAAESEPPEGGFLSITDTGDKQLAANTPIGKTRVDRHNVQENVSSGATQSPLSESAVMVNAKGNAGSSKVIGRVVDGMNIVQAAYQNLPNTIDILSSWTAEDGDDFYRVGGVEVSSQSFSNYLNDIKNDLWYGGDPANMPPSEYRGQNIVGTEYTDTGNVYTLENGQTVSSEQVDLYRQEQAATPSIFERATQALDDYGLDWQTLSNTANTITNWSNMDTPQQMGSVGNITTSILVNKGVLSSQQGQAINRTIDNLSILANPDSTDIQRGAALASMGAATVTDNPMIFAGLNAISVLGSNASNDDKAAALANVGIRGAEASNIISRSTAGTLSSLLSVINTARNWDEMDDVQRGVSVINVGSQVLSSLNGMTFGSAGQVAGSQSPVSGGVSTTAGSEGYGSMLGRVAGGLGAAATTIMAAYTVDQTYKEQKEAPRSRSTTTTPAGFGAAGAAIGTMVGGPIGTAVGAGVGSLAGAVLSHTGGGKSSGQMLRDSWRNTMETSGFVSLGTRETGDENAHYVTLADGSRYDIGLDGGEKLQNKDGSTRHTFDVDWSNDAAVSSIPAAHLFAIATGLDPNSHSNMDTWHRATAQGLNAASSNANDQESIYGNFRSMMEQADIAPTQLGMRIESLRAQNIITDQEYGVYVNTLNNMYGTNFLISDKEESRQFLIQSIEATPKEQWDDYTKGLYETLTSDDKLKANQRTTDRRLNTEVQEI